MMWVRKGFLSPTCKWEEQLPNTRNRTLASLLSCITDHKGDNIILLSLTFFIDVCDLYERNNKKHAKKVAGYLVFCPTVSHEIWLNKTYLISWAASVLQVAFRGWLINLCYNFIIIHFYYGTILTFSILKSRAVYFWPQLKQMHRLELIIFIW